MTSETVGSASILIEADFGTFDEQLKARLVAAARSAGAAAERALKKSGNDSGKGFAGEVEKSVNRQSKSSGERSGSFFGNAFRTAAARAVGQGLFRGLAASAGGLLTALSPLTTILGGASAAVVALAGALVTASGSAISLAGILGSLGLAVGALTVGFSGVGDAVKAQSKAQAELAKTGAVSANTQKELDAALKNLAPSAAAVVTQLSSMAPAWEAVRRSVQGALFEGVAQSIAALGNQFLPILSRQLTTTATTLNSTGRSLATFLATGNRSSQINSIFTGLNGILRSLLAPLNTLSAGLLDTFQASLPFAQGLANTLATLTTNFGEFLSESVRSGAFNTFLTTATTLAQSLFRLLGNVATILGQVFAAGNAAGGGLLTLLANITGQFSQFLRSAEGQSALASFFGLISEAGETLVGIFQTLQPLLAGIGSLFRALQGPIKILGAALTGVFAQLSTTLGGFLAQLGPVLGQLVTALAPVVTILGGVLNGVLKALLPVVLSLVQAFATIVPTLAPIVAILGSVLVNALSQISGVLVQLIPVLAQAIAAFATGLAPALTILQPVLAQLVTSLLGVVQALIPILVSLIPVIPAIAALSVNVAQLVVALLPLVTSILGSMASLLTALAPTIAQLVPPIIAVIGAFAQMGLALVQVVAAIVGFVSRSIAAFASFRNGVIAQVSAAVASVASFVSSLIGKVTDAMAKVRGAVSDGIATVVAFFRNLPGQVVGALSGLAGQLYTAGVQAVAGLAKGITDKGRAVLDAAKDLASKVTGALDSVLHFGSPSKVTTALGQDTGQGFVNGIKSQVDAVGRAANDLASAGLVTPEVGTAAVQAAQAANVAVFDLGLSLVDGILAGFTRQQVALDQQMVRLADVLVTRVIALLRAINLPGINTLNIPGLANGGVISRDGIYRGAERNRPEAVIPLTKPRRAQQLMDSTGLSALVSAGRGSSSKTVEVPIHVAGNVVDYAALNSHIEAILQKYGFRPVLGLNVAGGSI